jgi:hypothetical protein
MTRHLLACLALTLAGPATAQQAIPFERLAKSALERMAPGDSNPETLDLERAFRGSCLYVRLGLYEVYLSRRSAEDPTHSDEFARVMQTVLDIQAAWLGWLEPVEEFRQAEKDLKTLRKWAASVRGGQLSALAKKGGDEVYAGLKAKGSVVEAAERFAAFMGTGQALGLAREDQAEPLVLAGDRTEFLELLSFCGWLYPYLQEIYWQDDVGSWTNCYVDRYKFISMQFASPFGSAHWGAGTPMDANAEDGLAQQVTQLAANSLIDSYFAARIPPSLAGALSVNLTIDVFGTCDTRVDGDLTSRRTEAFEMFVPGGASEGGWLPARAADSRWREHQGSDHFVAVLKAAQKNGAEEMARAKGKLQHFELENDAGNKRRTVSGPFLGSPAEDLVEPPQQYQGDYKEFLRSYRSCFVHWLRDESQGKEKASRVAFARWLMHLGSEQDMSLEQSLEEVFGAPLSHTDLDQKVLEGSFLTWLKKAK